MSQLSITNTFAELFNEIQLQNLQQDAPTPLYFRLYNLLKFAILDGTIDNGAKMPTEQQLAEIFSVGRITAKRAMDELAAEHLIERRRGKGSHVTYEYSPHPMKAPLIGMLQEIESMARHSDVKVLECKDRKPPSYVRDILEMDNDDKALHLMRVRSRDGQPFGYFDSWTTGLTKPLKKLDFKKSPRFEIFSKQNLVISHVTQTIGAAAADEEMARLLETETGTPLTSMIRHSFAMLGGRERLVDYLHLCYHPERFQYRWDLRLDNE